jgi:integrase
VQHPLINRGLMFPSRVAKRSGRVLSSSGYVSNAGLGKAIERACDAAKTNLADRPWIHVLRHTYNNLLRQVAPEIVRQALIGHADQAIGRRYSKVSDSERKAAAGAVVKLVRGHDER